MSHQRVKITEIWLLTSEQQKQTGTIGVRSSGDQNRDELLKCFTAQPSSKGKSFRTLRYLS